MGIKNLMQFLKKKHNECISVKNIEELRDKTICIDTPCLVYKYKFSSENWINQMIYFIVQNIQNNTDMLFIMEGKSPVEKKSTQIQRRESRDKVNNKTKYLKVLLDEYKETGKISEELNTEWKKLSKDDFTENQFERIIKKRESYNISVTNEDYNILQKLLDSFNVSWITSENEAETLCGYINNVKKCDYIYSHDSDVLAYTGVNGFINEINFKEKSFTFVCKKTILKELKINEEQFIEFCILCGTDYNVNDIKKFGIISSYNFISSNKQINDMKLDQDIREKLNVDFVKNKFSHQDCNHIEFKYKWPLFDKDKLHKIIQDYSLVLYKNTWSLIENLNKNIE